MGILASIIGFLRLGFHRSLLIHCRVLALAGACVKCSKGVFGAGQACQAMGNLYHDACFTCAACSKCVRGRGEGVRILGTEKGGQGRASVQETLGPPPSTVPRKGRTVSSRAGFCTPSIGPTGVR